MDNFGIHHYQGDDFDDDMPVQLFVSGPQNYVSHMSRDLRDQLLSFDNDVVVHSSYLDIGIWRNMPDSKTNVMDELNFCDIIGAKYFVVHLPAVVDPVLMSKRIGEVFSDIQFETTIVLESVPANKTLNISDLELPDGMGICIDTSHVHAAGIDQDMMLGMIKSIKDANIELMFHLNDSTHPLGSYRDKHEHLMKGMVWKSEDELTKLLRIVKDHTAIIENQSPKIDLKLIKRLLNA